MTSKILVKVERNHIYESDHRGWICVCDNKGNILKGTHEKYPEFFSRSSLKPIQALPFLFADGLKEFNFDIKELAIMCSSHNGEDVHRELVVEILKKIKLTEVDLKCGTHMPYSIENANKLIRESRNPTELYCNCSGKHAGMLATCLINGWSIKDYYDYNHPLQREIRKHISYLTGLDGDKLKWGIDGCTLPTYSFELNKLAEIFAKIANPKNLTEQYKEGFELIKKAFFQYPYLIAGVNRVDTQLMQLYPNKYISKMGGEAVLGLGIPNKNLGFAIKIEDGANRPMLPSLLHTLELLGEEKPSAESMVLKEPFIENNVKAHVGKVIPIFKF